MGKNVDGDLDRLVTSLPPMEGFLRRRDLPSVFRANNVDDPSIQFVLRDHAHTPRTQGLILNTFEDLEGPVLSQIRNNCPKTYAIGPLHELLKSRLASEMIMSQTSDGLWEEAKLCIAWLDDQLPKSVIFVSFGSVLAIEKDELIEFWYGLVNSGCHFLWVIRPNSLRREDREGQTPVELLEGTKERGLIVSWAPQEEVLAHSAVGGFLTHSGWNSTIEGIDAGVPMICWPRFADQQINSRFVSHVWEVGMDMKDICVGITIEKMIRTVMEEERAKFMKSVDSMAGLAKKCVSEGGSSYCNLISLIEDIRSLRS